MQRTRNIKPLASDGCVLLMLTKTVLSCGLEGVT